MNKWRTLWLDELGKAWKEDVDAASSFNGLAGMIERDWRPVARDALLAATNSTEDEWPEFKAGLESERRREFAGNHWAERWGPILIPDVFVRLAGVPKDASMPLPVVCDRLAELGVLVKTGNHYAVSDPDDGRESSTDKGGE